MICGPALMESDPLTLVYDLLIATGVGILFLFACWALGR